jgi:small subunit ribosomal protein S4
MYGLMERQFRKYFAIASKSKGVTGKVLLQLLERRLDNAVFRLGWALSRAQARQMVGHGFIQVNSRRVNIGSFLLKASDVIQAVPKDKARELIRQNMEAAKDRSVAGWLDADPKEFRASVTRFPEKADIQQPIEEQLIVELYSK